MSKIESKKTYNTPDPFKSGDNMKKVMNRLNIDADTAESYLRRINNIVSINKNYINGMNPFVLVKALQLDEYITTNSGITVNDSINDFLAEQNYQGTTDESADVLKVAIIRYYIWLRMMENNKPSRDHVPDDWYYLWTPQDLYVGQERMVVEESSDIIG